MADAPVTQGSSVEFILEENAIAVLRVRGEIDILTMGAFERELDRATTGARHLIVDLTEAMFFDASGLRALDGARRRSMESGRTMVLISPTGTIVRRLIDIVRLHDAIPTFDTLDAAIAAIGGRHG